MIMQIVQKEMPSIWVSEDGCVDMSRWHVLLICKAHDLGIYKLVKYICI